MAVVNIPLNPTNLGVGHAPPPPGAAVWLSEGTYDFSVVDSAILSVLRKNPNVFLICELSIYPPADWLAGHPNDLLVDYTGTTKTGLPSYASQAWKEAGSRAVSDVASHVNGSWYRNAVIGYFVTGGDDGQFVYYNRGRYDFSPASVSGYRSWLAEKYTDIGDLNETWGSSYSSFEDVAIPQPQSMEASEPIRPLGNYSDYYLFRAHSSWSLRDAFAKSAKETMDKPVVAFCYGPSLSAAISDLANIDGFGGQPAYQVRRAGYASLYEDRDAASVANKLYFAELDLRSFVGSNYAEIDYERYAACQDISEWIPIHRKYVGRSLAFNEGYWYYDQQQYFNDPEIHADIQATYSVAKRLSAARANRSDGGHPGFSPSVAVVEPDDALAHEPDDYNACRSFFMNQIQSSGVPYTRMQQSAALAGDLLDSYRLIVFNGVFVLDAAQRQTVERLKSEGRTLVFVYGTGYVVPGGKSVQEMRDLIGIAVQTDGQYRRDLVFVEDEPLSDIQRRLLTGVDRAGDDYDTLCSIFTSGGSLSFVPRSQSFWVEDSEAVPLARFAGSQEVAISYRELDDWQSVYVAHPYGLSAGLLNSLVRDVGGYVAGDSGQEIITNGDFMMIHALVGGLWTVRLPAGRSTAVDAFTGEVVSDGPEEFTVSLEAQDVRWLLLS
jgi:hypothetical protein